MGHPSLTNMVGAWNGVAFPHSGKPVLAFTLCTASTRKRRSGEERKRKDRLPGMTEGHSVPGTHHVRQTRAAHFSVKQGCLSLDAVK